MTPTAAASPSPSAPQGSPQALRALTERWAGAKPGERANTALFIQELCVALGVEPPRPAGSGYEFERAIKVFARDGHATTNFIDLYKAGHFILEAKDEEPGRSSDVLLRKAFGQARTYAAHDPSGAYPPYLLVLNGQRELLVWDRWTGDYGGYSAHRRIELTRLHELTAEAELLRDIWNHPAARDPRLRAQRVTERIAEKLARLAAGLEARGFGQERVSRFLIRCVFTMFAEDVRLLVDEPFHRLLDEVALANPAEFVPGAEELWRAMDEGKRFGFRKLLRFNGAFFRDAEALPLERDELAVLLEAAKADWSEVEPAIFGTLLTRALDPRERHRLGAEYTKPEMIARVIKPAVEEPIRERWTAVQAEVLQLRERGKTKDLRLAEQRLREFHAWLRGLRFLDPACGSGNFLYVTMHAVKRVEVEVLTELADLTGHHELRFQEVDPSQFHGLEVKRWAREIAELTLWIGFHQFWRQVHGDVQPDEPLLRDTGTLEHRDAVLAHDGEFRDAARDRPDPTPRIRHPVTGDLVPDPSARLEYRALVNPRPAEWPEADFIIGNPPFMGQLRQRDALGDGYVEALRAAYPEVPDSADLVMYWVHKAARAVASGRALRAGLITTQSITQKQNRKVLEVAEKEGVRPVWAIADHYWNDGADDARVRVAMTVLAREPASATLVAVDGDASVVSTVQVPRLNADLSAHADVPRAAAVRLLGNEGLCSNGYKPHGTGFLIEAQEAERLLALDARHAEVLRPYRNGMDLATQPRGVWIIDFAFATEEEARVYPVLFDIVRDRVKPERDTNARAIYRTYWWRFGEARREWRDAVKGLPRYIATVSTAKHRFFTFLDAAVAPDNKLTCVASASAFHLGVLSSAVHATWALAAGSRLGIDGTPSYDKGSCFDAFPFPEPPTELGERIATVAERIVAHRDAALVRSRKVGMTVMYNVVDKLRSGEALTPKEKDVHTLAACGTLRELHDELDRLVAEAYGWPWPEQSARILERLVALHEQRVGEERVGRVCWLRPEYQRARFGKGVETVTDAPVRDVPTEDDASIPAQTGAPEAQVPWPADAVGQITVLRTLAAMSPLTVEQAVRRFSGAKRDIVARHLETLAILGEVRDVGGGRYAVSSGSY